MKMAEIKKTKLTSVSCNGKEGVFDHPKIYLQIDLNIGEATCPYCSKNFVLSK